MGAQKEKPQSRPVSETLPAYDGYEQEPDTSRESIELDNDAFTNPLDRELEDEQPLPIWLLRNLLVAKISVFLGFLLGPALCTFGIMMRDDLANDDSDYTCSNNYVAQAWIPWDESIIAPLPGEGRYHAHCRILYHWSMLLISAGSLSIWRPMMQCISAYQPTQWTFTYSSTGKIASFHTPTRVYALRTVFSAVPAILYLICAFMLGTSRLIAGPKPEEGWYRPIYLVCLGLICLSFVLSLHQAMSTGVAACKLRGFRMTRYGLRPSGQE